MINDSILELFFNLCRPFIFIGVEIFRYCNEQNVYIVRWFFSVAENSVNNFDIFETETKESELILSPKSFVNGSEKSTEASNNSQPSAGEETSKWNTILFENFFYSYVGLPAFQAYLQRWRHFQRARICEKL